MGGVTFKELAIVLLLVRRAVRCAVVKQGTL